MTRDQSPAATSELDVQVWRALSEPANEPLVAAAMALDEHDVQAVARLRAMVRAADAPSLVRAALQLARARQKARAKFGDRALDMWGDPQGVEMASSLLVSTYKAARFKELSDRAGTEALDLCCGIGGDAMALSRAGVRTVGVDLSAARAWMCERNASCQSRTSDVAAYLDHVGDALSSLAVHIDPSRRTTSGDRRLHRYMDLSPGPEVIERVIDSAAGACVKLGPGVDLTDLPDGEAEFISERGQLTQCVLWSGALARADMTRVATLLTPEGPCSVQARVPRGQEPPSVAVSPLKRVVFEVDPSVERAGLLGVFGHEVGLSMVHERVGLFTGDAPVSHPILTPFEVLADLAWNPRRVREELSRLGAGIVEVKTRGKAVDPDTVQMDLRGSGARPLVVFILRFGRELRCIIASRGA